MHILDKMQSLLYLNSKCILGQYKVDFYDQKNTKIYLEIK